ADDPTGCPRAIAPPLTLVLSQSISPIGPSVLYFACQAADGKTRAQARTWAANASLISTRPISFQLSPARLSASGVATAGPSPIRPGSSAQNAEPRIRPSGERPRAFAADALMTSMAAPPSVICDEFPAVTVPNRRSK